MICDETDHDDKKDLDVEDLPASTWRETMANVKMQEKKYVENMMPTTTANQRPNPDVEP